MSLDLTVLSDGELAALSLGGREAAFAELMRRHRDAIYRLIRGHIGDAEEALDVTQDCFAAAFQNLARYDRTRSMRAWLVSIAINKSRDWRRRRRVRDFFASSLPRGAIEAIGDAAPNSHYLANDRAELARLESALSRLPATLKETLLLRTIEGLSQAETARALSISEKAVETRLYRARARLSEILGRP